MVEAAAISIVSAFCFPIAWKVGGHYAEVIVFRLGQRMGFSDSQGITAGS